MKGRRRAPHEALGDVSGEAYRTAPCFKYYLGTNAVTTNIKNEIILKTNQEELNRVGRR
jgi:hypothetical protein